MAIAHNGLAVTRRLFVQALGAAVAAWAAGHVQAARAAGSEASLIATFLDVGKADAIVLQSEDRCVMVDTGAAETASDVVASLADLGVDKIDALVITHFDQDHVGGAAEVLRNVAVDKVYVTYESKESEEIDAYHEALDEVGLAPCELEVGSTLDLTVGAMDLHFIAPQSTDYGENNTSNDSSLVVRVTVDDVVLLLTGDIERDRIDELLDGNEDLTCDLLKMPHHGGREKNTDDLIEACAPTYAVITSSNDEKEDDKTADDLEDAGVEYYLTREGAVTVSVAGGELSIVQ